MGMNCSEFHCLTAWLFGFVLALWFTLTLSAKSQFTLALQPGFEY